MILSECTQLSNDQFKDFLTRNDELISGQSLNTSSTFATKLAATSASLATFLSGMALYETTNPALNVVGFSVIAVSPLVALHTESFFNKVADKLAEKIDLVSEKFSNQFNLLKDKFSLNNTEISNKNLDEEIKLASIKLREKLSSKRAERDNFLTR